MIKPEVNDPQGLVIMDSLKRLGFNSVTSLRAGKFFELKLTALSKEAAEASVNEMCSSLLVQPVTEIFEISVSPTT